MGITMASQSINNYMSQEFNAPTPYPHRSDTNPLPLSVGLVLYLFCVLLGSRLFVRTKCPYFKITGVYNSVEFHLGQFGKKAAFVKQTAWICFHCFVAGGLGIRVLL